MADGARRPYNSPLMYGFKINWAVGERVIRALLLNRRAPEVAGIIRRVPYVHGGHRLQTLDVIRPLGEPPFPVLVYIHGGAHHLGDKGTYDRICKCFAAAGFLVFNVNYRMAPGWGYPEQVKDAAEAINYACRNAGLLGGDSDRVFIAGDSAGAYFATMYTAMAMDEATMQAIPVSECMPADAIKGLLLFYGVYNLESVGHTKFPLADKWVTGYLGRDPDIFEERARLASPIRHLKPDFPPCFIASSELDPLHSETVAFIRALDAEGIPYDYLNLPRDKYPFTYHGFLNFWFTKAAHNAMRGALDFLSRHI
jgi:acetyl esterase